MKKLLFISMFALLVSSLTFAAVKSTSSSGNGNGGKDKIGGYIGSPFGLSYSHEFNDLVEFDLVAGYGGIWGYHRLDVQLGALFTVFDPVLSGLGDQHCPLSLGPVLGGSFTFVKYANETLLGGVISLMVPIRWEINFGNIPDFNLFIDVAPVGVAINFVPSKVPDSVTPSGVTYKNEIHTVWSYTSRFGVGLRYRIPNKK
ncbi:hypothetical protein E4N72_00295 [Treponema vincentii]|uniref:hypothetical protein n=1 Tax=Treponema vincentii TaxID=69710 RepID=UPI0020A3A9E7|nr:hypothetical protein [Treponema vincentii]UTC45134.1 hypothetical protein E4N72_00295 [Treponema vincentii]